MDFGITALSGAQETQQMLLAIYLWAYIIPIRYGAFVIQQTVKVLRLDLLVWRIILLGNYW